MEESGEVQCEENKALLDKNKKRRFKTPAQLQALEDFYNEHKYPTESMKADLAVKLGLTEKQISGWFCHRRLKDKKVINGEGNPSVRQEFSSGVIQDRGSGLKQDSCSSTKQGDYRLADLREVESRRFGHNDFPAAEINYEQTMLDDGNEMDDTSSESNSALQGSIYPPKRSSLDAETTQFQAPNGLIAQNRKRVGPSGYLKIKGQTENAAVTAVKRQLGRHYREDGPSLGIEFDPLPPGAFESPSKNANSDAYGVPEHIGSSSFDVGVIHKRPGFSKIRNQEKYVVPTDSTLHKSDPGSFSYRQPKQKSPFSNHGRVPAKKSSFYDFYAAREPSDFDSSANHNIPHKHGLPGTGSDSYCGKVTSEPEEPMWHNYDNGFPVAGRRRERLDSKSIAVPVRHKDPMYNDDGLPPSRIMKDEEIYADRRAIGEHHDSARFKMRPTNELRAGKKGREEFLQQEYAIRQSFQEPSQWSRQIRGKMMENKKMKESGFLYFEGEMFSIIIRSTELPSSFSEDETAETSSSVD